MSLLDEILDESQLENLLERETQEELSRLTNLFDASDYGNPPALETELPDRDVFPGNPETEKCFSLGFSPRAVTKWRLENETTDGPLLEIPADCPENVDTPVT